MKGDALGSLCWVEDLLQSTRSRVYKRVVNAVLATATASAKASGRTTRLPFRVVKVPADGRCGWRSILAAMDPAAFERVPRILGVQEHGSNLRPSGYHGYNIHPGSIYMHERPYVRMHIHTHTYIYTYTYALIYIYNTISCMCTDGGSIRFPESRIRAPTQTHEERGELCHQPSAGPGRAKGGTRTLWGSLIFGRKLFCGIAIFAHAGIRVDIHIWQNCNDIL